MTVTRRIRSPGRARNKPLKPLRAGMPGDLGATCGDYARVLHLNFAREAMGAAGTRHSPRPRGRNCPTSLGRLAPRECEAVSAINAAVLKIESGFRSRGRKRNSRLLPPRTDTCPHPEER